MSETAPSESFIRHLTLAQHGLFAYVTSLVGDADAANDVMQETNIVLCRKWQEFDETRSFSSWAAKFAHFKALEYNRALRRREQRVVLRDDLVDLIAEEAQESEAFDADYTTALDTCMDGLSSDARAMLDDRYTRELSTKELADARGRTASSVSVSLFRARRALLECIQRKLGLGGAK